jgi:hypothetical protein
MQVSQTTFYMYASFPVSRLTVNAPLLSPLHEHKITNCCSCHRSRLHFVCKHFYQDTSLLIQINGGTWMQRDVHTVALKGFEQPHRTWRDANKTAPPGFFKWRFYLK